uniref:carboxylesterase family protein n=1 Tax=Ningiella ruwaisensis TaxID=2364274 RepID=UPI0010A0A3F7|nr:dienelactone hydrolase family protein [Ningiella ruwaisensis]
MKKVFLSLLSLFGLAANAQPVDYPEYEKHQFTDTRFNTKASLPYRILYPANFDASKKYPVVLFLHGAGERGSDNVAQLTHGAELFLSESFRQSYPAIVVFPQAAEDDYWVNVEVERAPNNNVFHFKPLNAPKTQSMALLQGLVLDLKERDYIDADNMLVMGLSMGGMGTLDIIASMPSSFRAAVAICGGAHETLAPIIAKSTPVWAFHGSDDEVVPLSASEEIINAIIAHEGDAKLKIYDGVGHDSWNNAFEEPELISWLFSYTDFRP